MLASHVPSLLLHKSVQAVDGWPFLAIRAGMQNLGSSAFCKHLKAHPGQVELFLFLNLASSLLKHLPGDGFRLHDDDCPVPVSASMLYHGVPSFVHHSPSRGITL